MPPWIPQALRKLRSQTGFPAPRCWGARRSSSSCLPMCLYFCFLPPCCKASLLYNRCNKLAVLMHMAAWLFLDGRKSRSWTPCLLGATQASQAGDGWGCSSSSPCPSPSLLKAGLHSPGSPGHVPRATGRGGCARTAGFPPLWGCLWTINKNVLWKQQHTCSGDDAIFSAIGSSYSLSSLHPRSWYFVWGDEMQRVANIFVNQFTSNVDICSCILPSCWELD